MAEEQGILTPQFMRALDKLNLQVRRIFGGHLQGKKRTRVLGQSVEFADFREYAPGDDLRFLDWNIYGRLEKLFLRQYYDERDLSLYIILDRSASMASGTPDKFLHARRIAAALGFIALMNQDSLNLSVHTDALEDRMRSAAGRHHAIRLFRLLGELKAEGKTGINATVERFASIPRRKGLVVLIGDFLDPAGCRQALRHIAGRGHELWMIQVLSPQELEPEIRGDFNLVDVETGDTREVTISPASLKRYKDRLNAHFAELEGLSRQYGADYFLSISDQPVEEFVLKTLTAKGRLGR